MKKWIILTAFGLVGSIACKEAVDEKWERARTEVELKVTYGKVQFGLHEFHQAFNRFPSTEEGLEILVNNPGNLSQWQGPYVDKKYLKDPWRRKLQYRLVNGKPKIYSKGRSGTENIDLDTILDRGEDN